MPLVDVTYASQVAEDRLRDAIVEAAETPKVGVYLSLPVAAWSQDE